MPQSTDNSSAIAKHPDRVVASFSTTKLDTSSLTTTSKGTKLEPLTAPPGKELDLSGQVGTVKADLKLDDIPSSDTTGIPESDDRYKVFFRVKIGGVSTANQPQAGQPPASDASAIAATQQAAGSGELKVASTFEGGASFYGKGDGFDGKKTASGEAFDTNKLTAAHKTLPFGTQVRVTNKANNKSVVVKINDRGPYAAGRVLDLSYAAAQAIDMVSAGHAQVKAEVLEKQNTASSLQSASTTASTKPSSSSTASSLPDSSKQDSKAPKSAPVNQQATSKNPLAPDTSTSADLTQMFTSANSPSSQGFTSGSNLGFSTGTSITAASTNALNQSALSATQLEEALRQGQVAPLPSQPDQNLPDTAREFIFDNLKGDIITTHDTPYISLSSYQHSTAKFVISDPDDTLRPQLAKLENVEIEAGFVNGYKINKFVGVIYTIGRRLPGGTEIEAIDVSSQLAQTSTAAVPSANIDPTANAATPPADTASTAGFKVKSTFTGDASFYGHGDGTDGGAVAKQGEKFDASKLTAAHKTLPLDSIVRVTNTKNNKSVIVRINDRGPYVAGRVIDLSYAAAQAIDLVSAGHGPIKGEVLDAPVGTEVSQGKGSTLASSSQPSSKPTSAKPESSKPESGKPTSSSAAPSKQAPLAPDKAIAQTTDITTTSSGDLSKMFADATPKRSLAKAFVEGTNLKIAPEDYKLEKEGASVLQQSALSAAELEAALQGKVIATRGNTVNVTSPGGGTSSGVTLDYVGNRSAFIGHPVVTKRTNRQLQSGYGAIAATYYNMSNKQVEGVVAVTPAPVMQHPTGVISAPDWGSQLLSQPIVPGSPYTWADATKNGSRVPASKEIMQGIVRICQIITPMTKETGQTKWKINSWYRDPASNKANGGASASRHMSGDAVDFYFDGPEYLKIFQKLWADGPSGSGGWQGGVAKGNGFIHIDDRASQGKGRARWYYPGAH